MAQESQSQKVALVQKLKECTSCKRNLPFSCYGILRSAPDYYNPICKDCRNYRRRKTYNANSIEQVTYPLKENNRKILEKIVQGAKNFIEARSTVNEHKIRVSIDLNKDSPRFEVDYCDGSHVVIYQCCDQRITAFVEVAIMILEDLKIRLIE